MKTFLLISLLALIVGVIVFVLVFDPFASSRTHESIAEEIRTLSTLTVVEHFYQFVFPFDFLPDEETQVILASGQAPPQTVAPSEVEAYRIARETRLLTPFYDPSFVVINTRVRAGFTFEAPPAVAVEELAVEILLDEPEIHFVEIEDIDEHYSYPPIELDARDWQKISAYIRNRAIEYAEEEYILQKARSQAEESIATLLQSVGYTSVTVTFR